MGEVPRLCARGTLTGDDGRDCCVADDGRSVCSCGSTGEEAESSRRGNALLKLVRESSAASEITDGSWTIDERTVSSSCCGELCQPVKDSRVGDSRLWATLVTMRLLLGSLIALGGVVARTEAAAVAVAGLPFSEPPREATDPALLCDEVFLFMGV